MSNRSTWILVVVFLALLAFLAWMPRLQENFVKPTTTPTVVTSEKLFDILPSDIIAFKVVSLQGKAFAAQRDSNNLWQTDGYTETIDSAAIEETINQFAGTTIVAKVEDTSDPELYGLGSPANYTLTVTFRDGTQSVINPGDVSPTGRGYYARVNAEQILLLSKYSLGRLLDFLDNPPIVVSTATPTVTP